MKLASKSIWVVREKARSWIPESAYIGFIQEADPVITAGLPFQDRAVEFIGAIEKPVDNPGHGTGHKIPSGFS
jgi:hypothetical protein